MQEIRVAILGLGRVGELFAEHFLEQVQESGKPVRIVAVADRNPESPVALGFVHSGTPVYSDAMEVCDLADGIDIILDLTGNAELRQSLRDKLQAAGNRNTVIAPESFARLLWCFFDEPAALPEVHGHMGY
jgi:glyceraldehyde-3-phosphate dehydrogenase/erythrose-4-phosphate dehydrogenase